MQDPSMDAKIREWEFEEKYLHILKISLSRYLLISKGETKKGRNNMFTVEKAGRHHLDKKRRTHIISNRTYPHHMCPGRMHIDTSLLRSYPKFITSI